jgi:hypothetical protein
MKDSQLTSGERGIHFTLVFNLHVQARNILEALPKNNTSNPPPLVLAM